MQVEELMARVRARCAPHRGGVAGFCGSCFRAELEDVLHAEHPGMKRDDVVQLVDEWMLAAHAAPH